jgi:CHAT domain-containing protein/Tfp pilus assembly protein PilF
MKLSHLSLILIALCAEPVLALSSGIEEAEKLFAEAEKLQASGKFDEAILIQEKGIATYEAIPDSDQFRLTEALNRLGDLYAEMGRYQEAESALQRAIAIRRKIRGEDHPDTAGIMNDLGMLYENTGRLKEAEAIYLKALEIRERGLGSDHLEVSLSLNSLAWFYYYTGRYSESETLYRRALAIREKRLGADHRDVATVLNNFGVLLNEMGRYDEAESVLKRALEIRQAKLEPDHAHIGTTLNNLALVYRSTGRFDEAVGLYRKTLEVMEKAYGPEHANVGTVLTNLGRIYFLQQNFSEAEPVLKRALQIREKALGAEHPQVSFATEALAGLYLEEKKYDQAGFFLERTEAIRAKALGVRHPSNTSVIVKRALLSRMRKDFSGALNQYKTALEIREENSGGKHPGRAVPLSGLAFASAALGKQEEARSYFEQALDVHTSTRETVFALLSDRQKLSFLSLQEPDLHASISHTLQFATRDPKDLENTFNRWLQWKGSLLEAQSRYQQALVLSEKEPFREKWEVLQEVRRELAQLWIGGPGRKSNEEYRKRVQELEEKKQLLEAELTSMSRSFQYDDTIRKANAETLQKHIPEESVYLDFGLIRWHDFSTDETARPHYILFLLFPEGHQNVIAIDLGDAEIIEKAVRNFISFVRENASASTRNRLSRQLYTLLFGKAEPYLKGRKRFVISPDALLHLLPFEILITPAGRTLLEAFDISYVASGRDIFRWRDPVELNSGAMIVADPVYSIQPLGEEDQESKEITNILRKQSLGPLPGARREAEIIRRILSEKSSEEVEMYVGDQASESKLVTSKSGRRILHIAAHGFFLSDGETLEIPETGNSLLSGWAPQAAYRNPMLRSGILLSPSSPEPQLASEDGILSAEEILSLNLRGTELVTLSACDTALGEIHHGEGVLGLQRSLILAGSRTLIMSLWQVSDKATEDLMKRFYSLWTAGLNKSQAFRQARLELYRINSDPFFWGAFIMIGAPE